MSDKFQCTPTDELLRAKDARIAELEAQLTQRTIELQRAQTCTGLMAWQKLAHAQCAIIDGFAEALLPTFELIANDVDRFGAHRGTPVAPIINEFFLRAYGPQSEKQPAASEAPKEEGDGRELFHFTHIAKVITEAGTSVKVATTDDGAAFSINVTSTGSAGKRNTQSIGLRANTLYAIVSLAAALTNRSIVVVPSQLPPASMQ
ncbi:hypothetical protein [Burkholderia sp. Ac-20349]|uniref:hypothetical protein n=1 Tax=Burkholderia sp. Ac-20349 TaxID=2703893 RepID=UPI00197C02BE|nr:hypothetical protein [Burkholderia sp. Ac-20349]MBN3839253.1 hypothetical protein [Burkholderia sp. Ac-20349]